MGYWDSDLGEEGGYCDIYPAAMTTVELISTTGDPPPEGSITGRLYSKVKGTGRPRYSESSTGLAAQRCGLYRKVNGTAKQATLRHAEHSPRPQGSDHGVFGGSSRVV